MLDENAIFFFVSNLHCSSVLTEFTALPVFPRTFLDNTVSAKKKKKQETAGQYLHTLAVRNSPCPESENYAD